MFLRQNVKEEKRLLQNSKGYVKNPKVTMEFPLWRNGINGVSAAPRNRFDHSWHSGLKDPALLQLWPGTSYAAGQPKKEEKKKKKPRVTICRKNLVNKNLALTLTTNESLSKSHDLLGLSFLFYKMTRLDKIITLRALLEFQYPDGKQSC